MSYHLRPPRPRFRFFRNLVNPTLPKNIKNPFHDCTLSLVEHPSNYWCASCHKSFLYGRECYMCSKCNFFMDPDCAAMEQIECKDGQLHIQHFSHQHPMPFYEVCSISKIKVCFACQSPCVGAPSYACKKCNYVLHKRCAECPTEVTHPSHPHHKLSLHFDHDKVNDCNSCERNYCSFIFLCSQNCNYKMCIDCYLLPKQISHDQFVLHSHHDHPQDLSISIINSSNNYSQLACNLCHVNYIDISQPRYICPSCDFVVDVECALTPPITYEGHGHFRHFSHPHTLTLVDVDGEDENCFACDLPSQRGLAYACTKCKFILHKFCGEFSPKVYPSMVDHRCLAPLVHKELHYEMKYCNLCSVNRSHCFLFQCSFEDCGFTLCGRCIMSRIVKYKRHSHPHVLCLDEKVTNRECDAYSGYCRLPVTSIELRSTEFIMFRCFACGFNIHLLCGLLPPIIEYEYHIHPLTLVDFLGEDSSEEYCCDVCEEKRDPKICIYSCQECKYVAHVHCMISKVLTALRGDCTNVEFKTVRIKGVEDEKQEKAAIRNDVKREFTIKKFKDMVKLVPEYEQILLWRDFDWAISVECQQPAGENVGDTAPIWIRRLSHFTTEYFEDFIAWLNELYYSERLKVFFRDLLDRDVVDIEGYKIPRHLTRFLVLLLRGLGDISSDSKSTPEMKSTIFGFICKVLESMSSTTLVRVTKDDLKEWFFFLNYAKRRGFDTEFMFDHLKDVARAFVGLQATATRNGGIGIERVHADDILKLRHELESLMANSDDIGFINWGEFTTECLSMALKFMDKDHVAIHGLYVSKGGDWLY